MGTKIRLLATVVALACSGQVVAQSMDTVDSLDWRRGQVRGPLEGTWVVRIHPVACATGEDVPGIPAIITYVTFARGGTLTETNSSTNFEPGQRGPGHGIWERTGRTSYQFAYQAFIQFDSTKEPFRYKRGYQRLDQTVELHTADDFSAVGTVKFFVGSPAVESFPSGCARSVGERMY